MLSLLEGAGSIPGWGARIPQHAIKLGLKKWKDKGCFMLMDGKS